MPSLSERDAGNLYAIIEACTKIQRFTSSTKDADQFYEDERTFDAVLMNFVIIGESVARLSQRFRAKNERVPWRKIKQFRNIVAHDYFGVDAEEVWQIIHNHLPILKRQVSELLSES